MRLERVISRPIPYAQHQPLFILHEGRQLSQRASTGTKAGSAVCRRDWQHARARVASAPCPNPAAVLSQHQSTRPRSRIPPSVALILFPRGSPTQYEPPLPQSQVPIVLRPSSFTLRPKSSPSPSPRFRQDLPRVQARQLQR